MNSFNFTHNIPDLPPGITDDDVWAGESLDIEDPKVAPDYWDDAEFWER
jgi:hypothetical protein